MASKATGRKLVYVAHDTVDMPDVASFYRKPQLTRSGFRFQLPIRLVPAGTEHPPVRIFSVFGGEAMELHYPATFEWIE